MLGDTANGSEINQGITIHSLLTSIYTDLR